MFSIPQLLRWDKMRWRKVTKRNMKQGNMTLTISQAASKAKAIWKKWIRRINIIFRQTRAWKSQIMLNYLLLYDVCVEHEIIIRTKKTWEKRKISRCRIGNIRRHCHYVGYRIDIYAQSYSLHATHISTLTTDDVTSPCTKIEFSIV